MVMAAATAIHWRTTNGSTKLAKFRIKLYMIYIYMIYTYILYIYNYIYISIFRGVIIVFFAMFCSINLNLDVFGPLAGWNCRSSHWALTLKGRN